jgi:hypothetical protein
VSAKHARPKTWYTGRAATVDAGAAAPAAAVVPGPDPGSPPQVAVPAVPAAVAPAAAVPAAAAATDVTFPSTSEPSQGFQANIPSEIERLIEEIGARYIADLQALSRAFAGFYSGQLAARDEQIATLKESLAAVQSERQALSARVEEPQKTPQEPDAVTTSVRDPGPIRQERDELADRRQQLEQARFRTIRAITREVGTVALPATTPVRAVPERPAGASGRCEAPADLTAQLLIQAHGGDSRAGGTTFVLRSDAVVGRRSGSDVQINDSFISSEHARLTLREGRWWVLDLGSTNGTFVNNARVTRPVALNHGDEVRFGRVCTRFTLPIGRYLALQAPQASADRPSNSDLR